GIFHAPNPLDWSSVPVLLIEGGHDLLLEEPVNRIGSFRVVVSLDSPAVFAVVALVPPAVQDAEVGNAIQRSLLATGAAGFLRRLRIIEPDVDTLNQVVRDMLVVIFDKCQAPGQFR